MLPEDQQEPPGLETLRALRSSSDPPRTFWVAYLAALAQVAEASRVALFRREGSNGAWQPVCVSPPSTAKSPELRTLAESAASLWGKQGGNGYLGQHLERTADGSYLGAVRLDTGDPKEESVLTCLFPSTSEPEACERLRRVLLAADAPASYQTGRLLRRASEDVQRFSSVLDLQVALNEENRFLAVALTFCNELAGRHRCDRVSLGWCGRDRYVRVEAISHTERFERKMEAVQLLAYAMEEALDQDDEVLWPSEDGALVTRDHQAYSESLKGANLCSVPIRLEGEPVGVITCERTNGTFDAAELRILRLSCDLAARRLAELKKHDRWFGARWLAASRDALSKLLGVEHTGAKAIGVVVAVLLAVLFFGRASYRVEGTFILRADEVVHVPAPFPGFIQEVLAEPGDDVQAGDTLLALDTRELLLEGAAAAAEVQRNTREADKARATGQLAEMRIAESAASEAQARLDLVHFRLGRAAVKAPLDGVVVEGDLKDRIGAPLEAGDSLFRIAVLDRLYVELEVKESDIDDVHIDMTGQVAFTSQPEVKYPIQVEQIDPAAQTGREGSVFLVRCRILTSAAPWWKPGMSGIGKVDAGRRNLLWIVTHRTTDFLRMRLWW